MKLTDSVLQSKLVKQFLKKHGYTPPEGQAKRGLYDKLFPEDRVLVENSIKRLQDTAFYTDINAVAKEVNFVNKAIEKALGNNLQDGSSSKVLSFLNNLGAVGYEPAGSVLRKLYPNPFAPYAFLADNYWAADKARRELRVEIQRDSYVLIAEDRVANKEIKRVNDLLDNLGIPEYWVEWADHLDTFGNVWLEVDKNLLGKIGPQGKIRQFLPEHMIPVYDRWQDEIVGWEYQSKGKRYLYELDAIDHIKTYSTRSFQLGSPCLSSMMVEIEADMHAAIYNNTVMQKGGLIKGVLSLSQPDDNTIINENTFVDYANKIQELLNKKFSGVRGGGQMLALYGIDKYFDLNKIGEIDSIYANGSPRTAARTALMFGICPERLGIPSTSQYQNNVLISDSVALSMDNNQYWLTDLVAKYINEKILKERMGIEHIYLQASGEYGSLSLTAAKFGQAVALMGVKSVTVNEWRTRALHWEPCEDDSIGNAYLGDLLNQKDPVKTSKAFGALMPIDFSAGDRKWKRHKRKNIRYYE